MRKIMKLDDFIHSQPIFDIPYCLFMKYWQILILSINPQFESDNQHIWCSNRRIWPVWHCRFSATFSLCFQEQWRTCKIVQSSSLEYGEKKENTSEETEAASSQKIENVSQRRSWSLFSKTNGDCHTSLSWCQACWDCQSRRMHLWHGDPMVWSVRGGDANCLSSIKTQRQSRT